MRPIEARVLAAIDRNFAEADSALLKLTAYNKLATLTMPHPGMNFFVIAQQALFNDMVASAIRIFDDHKEAGSLWYIVRCNESAAKKAAQAFGISLDELRMMVPRLRHIRDKTHFHIDRRTVENPSKVWSGADISSGELSDAFHKVALLLAHMKQELYGGEIENLTRYDGSDVQVIVDAYIVQRERGL